MENIILNKLNGYMKTERDNSSKIFNELALWIYQQESGQHDLYILAKILEEKELFKLISYFDGDTIKLPTKEEHRALMLTAVCYYLKEVKRYGWNEIKEFLDLPENNAKLLSSISIGKKMCKLSEKMSRELAEILKGTNFQNFESFVKEFKEERL